MRGKDKSTNVLSFRQAHRPVVRLPRRPAAVGRRHYRVRRRDVEAARQGKTLAAISSIWSCTGSCICSAMTTSSMRMPSGMEALEIKILRRLGVADPYRRDVA